MLDLDVIDEPAAAAAALDPVRARVLTTLAEPGSATTIAKEIGEPRQKVNYHVRTLEEYGLVRLVEERQRRGLKERVLVASAKSYVVAAVLGERGADPSRADKLSTRYLSAIGARMVREVADLARSADRAEKSLATLTIDTEIRFGSAATRQAFTEELTNAVTDLSARYHDEATRGGRWHRLIVAAHPRPAHQSMEP